MLKSEWMRSNTVLNEIEYCFATLNVKYILMNMFIHHEIDF
jgi:hypothetical protein